MLLIDIYRYLKRRADKRPVYLKNFVDQSHHHGSRTSDPSVEIIIPTRDKVDLLRACVESIFEKTTYQNYRVTIVDNQSVEPATHEYFEDLINRGVNILRFPQKFNFSAMCNFAASSTDAEFVCFLNNDIMTIDNEWLSKGLDHAIIPNIGVVGSMLLYPQGNVQHVGIALGLGGLASHPYAGQDVNNLQKIDCLEVSAVTFAFALISASKYQQLGGLDEIFRVGLNDVDFGLRARRSGYANVVCMETRSIHFESATRAKMSSLRGAIRAIIEVLLFQRKWGRSDPREQFFSNSKKLSDHFHDI